MFLVWVRFVAVARILTAIILLGTILTPKERLNAGVRMSTFNVLVQTSCEQQMLSSLGGREVLRGKAYNVLVQVARTYGRSIPHIYTIPESMNMAYIGASIGVDGRGKILVGQ
jgi:hypothetical protein